MDSEHSSSPIWTGLWRSGQLHSCAGAYSGNYDGRLASFWREVFARVPGNAVVLDIGTGNGAIAQLAQEWSRGRQLEWEVHGTDLADINPWEARPQDRDALQGIRFHPLTPIHALPFESSTVALVCSQFAFEYAPRQSAVAELARVVAPGGRMAMVLHAEGSFVCTATREQLEHAEWVIDTSGLLPLTRELACELAPEGRGGDTLRIGILRRRLDTIAEVMKTRVMAGSTTDYLHKVRDVVATTLREAPRNPREVTISWFDRVCSGLGDERERLRAMHLAALDASALDVLAQELATAMDGAVTTGEVSHESEGRLGWTLEVASDAR